MIFDELHTGFRWYDSLSKQTRFKEYCESLCKFGLISPCDDVLPFQIRTDDFGEPISWILKYLDGTQIVPSNTPPTPLAWDTLFPFPLNTDLIYVIADFGGTDLIIGNAIWDTDGDTTMATLVQSMNTNTDNDPLDTTGMKAGLGYPTFDNSAGYTATYDPSGANTLTISAPSGTGAELNGITMRFYSYGAVANITPLPTQLQDWAGGSSSEVESDEINISDCIPFLSRYEIDSRVYLQYNGGSLPGCLRWF